MSRDLLNISRDGDLTTTLGALSVKKFPLISSPDLVWHNLRSSSVVLSRVPWEQDLMSCQGVVQSQKAPPSLLFSRLSPFPIRFVLQCGFVSIFCTPFLPNSCELSPLQFQSSKLQGIISSLVFLESWKSKTESQYLYFFHNCSSCLFSVSVLIYKIIILALIYERSNNKQ